MDKNLNTLLPVGIARYISLYPRCCHMGEDLMLADFSTFAMPSDVRHTTCIILALCTGGSAQYTVMGESHKVTTNDVLIISDGQVLGDIQDTADFSGYMLLVSRSFLEGVIGDLRKVSNLFVFAHENPVLKVEEHSARMIVYYLRLLRMLMEDSTHRYQREAVGSVLGGVVYEFANASDLTHAQMLTAHTRAEHVFKEYIGLVEVNYRTIRRVGWYSQQLGITPKSLLEIVKRVSGRTPNEWLDIYTVNELRNLLRHTQLSMKEISERLNFSTQGAMGKFFREHVGIAPSSYRQK